MNKRPIAIDLFAGAGGMSLGFEQAGFDIAAAVEIDPIHASVHHFNFPQTTTIPRSIVGLKGDEIKSLSGIGNRQIDVVFGGPPCQGFSLIGQRMFDDPRNNLVKEFVRVVAELKPKYCVLENVKGLTIGKHRVFLQNLIEAFKVEGYTIRVPWRVLNASHYDVPQNRERLFLLGARKGYKLPEYPESISDKVLLRKRQKTTPTCMDALGDLPNPERYKNLLVTDSTLAHDWGAPSPYASELRCISDSSWRYGYRRIWNPAILTSSLRTVHTKISQQRFQDTQEGSVEPISRFFKLSRKGLCNTLRAGTDSARGAFTSPRPIHYDAARCITVREMARLHGYPDWFRFHVTKWHGARQIGNSVPPPLARLVASSIISALGLTIEPPQNEIKLGDPLLLSMDMREAAAYWQVPIPIGKRDRKNGQHKRKQEDITDLFGAINYDH